MKNLTTFYLSDVLVYLRNEYKKRVIKQQIYFILNADAQLKYKWAVSDNSDQQVIPNPQNKYKALTLFTCINKLHLFSPVIKKKNSVKKRILQSYEYCRSV